MRTGLGITAPPHPQLDTPESTPSTTTAIWRKLPLSTPRSYVIVLPMTTTRHYTPLDRLLIGIDQSLRTVLAKPQGTGRANPGDTSAEQTLSPGDKRHVTGLMRVNHAGEIAAQALYQGQALTAQLPTVRQKMEQAAVEENDHLLWCEQRLRELDNHPSRLTPLWYAGSFVIGALAGAAGDKWSLGFVVETERQVIDHLNGHLATLPAHDAKSRAILEQMRADEQHHATTALEAGAAELPRPVKTLMQLTSKLMTKTAYRF